MVLPPMFVKPDREGLRDYYLRIAQAVDIPVIIQDAPQLTGVSDGSGALGTRSTPRLATIRYVKVEGIPAGPDDLRDPPPERRAAGGVLWLGRGRHPRCARARRGGQHAGAEFHPALYRGSAVL
ncbi:MAG: hypothetical protein KatS3mg059_0502 [Thermomicrobiales bacterium]|nr:MAG: hypothetical protein KatS3mg059_0502 [Thermomicrobiales bacterium]